MHAQAADYLADEKTVNDRRTAMGRNLGLEVLAKSPHTGPTHQVSPFRNPTPTHCEAVDRLGVHEFRQDAAVHCRLLIIVAL